MLEENNLNIFGAFLDSGPIRASNEALKLFFILCLSYIESQNSEYALGPLIIRSSVLGTGVEKYYKSAKQCSIISILRLHILFPRLL